MLPMRESVREPQPNVLKALSFRPDSSELIYPDFATLTAFEHVRDQYRGLGIRFDGAIALQPSHPAFAEECSPLVVMPMAGRSSIHAYFCQPRRRVGAVVVGARQIKITACDRHHRPLTRCMAGSHQPTLSQKTVSNLLPQHPVELFADGIMRIVFESNAPFILKQVCFS
ncbi:hypothetical protein IQ268_21120 [Oculatella sp. LEGE 06141]|uniref:hypothetical protein n=1 Tax=Oculatella sp. LEGE 06141 TaxID=1828648 RepID=UPI00187EED43|nr:hypothetical protein [Oculatella sp. LEGE 06141]MBE9181065.1 hypothetical protein [Oculatella sp. LEGE 06141]